jgi:hypothetical protein
VWLKGWCTCLPSTGTTKNKWLLIFKNKKCKAIKQKESSGEYVHDQGLDSILRNDTESKTHKRKTDEFNLI